MSFTSWAFVAFLAAVYAGYRLLPHRGQNLLLLAASYVFYGSWDVRFLFLLALSTVVYHSGGAMIARGSLTPRERASASLWTVGSAIAFVLVPWRGLEALLRGEAQRDGLAAFPTGWLVLAFACGLTLVANLLHGPVSRLEPGRRAKLCLWAAVGVNLAILALFKYTNFLLDNAGTLARALGAVDTSWHVRLALPVGISFYTFQGMTYVIDIHRKRLRPTPRLLDFALFMAFFPVILAGPIERAGRLLPQIVAPRPFRGHEAAIFLILRGLFKKAALADGAAVTANAVFGAAGPVTWIDAVAGTFFFAIQLYCDFSGYSDMALGIARLFGIELTTNFRTPYLSSSPAEFWTRWHVSLSSWFRDYVFFPLGGPYGGALRWIRNVMITFFVTGLWHGAAWNFVLWGLYHGALLTAYRLGESVRKGRAVARGPLLGAASIAGFFVLTCYGWVLFRAQSLAQIGALTRTLLLDFGNLRLTAPLPPETTLAGLPLLFVLEVTEFRLGGRRIEEALPVPVWTAAYAVMIFALLLGAGAVSSQFVYFTF
jgi:D-alanyl-lipoteichoic acid acyltransferase DltB (MBOAT superfamily)